MTRQIQKLIQLKLGSNLYRTNFSKGLLLKIPETLGSGNGKGNVGLIDHHYQCSNCHRNFWTDARRPFFSSSSSDQKANPKPKINNLDSEDGRSTGDFDFGNQNQNPESDSNSKSRGSTGGGDSNSTNPEDEGPSSKTGGSKDSNAEDESWSSKSKGPPPPDPSSTSLTTHDFFARIRAKNKENFALAIDVFIERDKHLRGHVEFIYAALAHMKEFGVHRDLEVYKKIVDVFPKGRFIPTNMWQVEFQHFPKQQQCGVDLLEQMAEYSVQPDSELEQMLINVFGTQGFPIRKLRRMLYWMPKFKNLSPWSLPSPMPDDSLELAKLAIERITKPDLETKITCINAMDLPDSVDPTWIVSGQSSLQRKLIEELPSDRPVYVEGAFRLWMRNVCMNYFILRAEPKKLPEAEPHDEDDVGFIRSIFQEDYKEKAVATVPTVHEQEDGIILAVCATGTSSRDSLLSWIRFLEESNPRLGKDISVLFTLKSPLGPTDDLEITEQVQGSDSGANATAGSLHGESENDSQKTKPHKYFLDPNPSDPSLDQIGIDSDSETRFPNWPHHFNPDGTPRVHGPRPSVGGGGSKKAEFLGKIQELKDEIHNLSNDSSSSLNKDKENKN